MGTIIPEYILKWIHQKTVSRPSPLDSNFNYIHQEDVFDIVREALDYNISNRVSDVHTN